MKMFVTGGTGFIGSHFIKQAHDAGHELVCLRREPSSRPKIDLASQPQWLHKSYHEVTADDLRGCEALVHLAAHSANVPYDTLEQCVEKNVLDPLHAFRAAVEAGVSRFIIAGSCFEYGSAGERFDFIPADAPLEPTTSYPASKAAASVVFHAFACETRVEMINFRIFQVYGEGESPSRFWPSLRKAALAGEDFPMSEGAQIRDFIRVDDVASKFVDALSRTDLKAGVPIIENLGTGRPCTLREFAEKEWAGFGAPGRLIVGAVPLRKNEIMRYAPEIPRGN